MKNVILPVSVLVLSLVLLSAKINPSKDTYLLDTTKSSAIWTGEKVTGKHMGTISIKSGELTNKNGQMTGQFELDMNSIVCTDLKGEGKTKLEGHLKDDDFFGVRKYPVASFVITSVKPLSGVEPGKPNFNVNGKLTIKGITNALSFPVLLRFNDSGLDRKSTL